MVVYNLLMKALKIALIVALVLSPIAIYLLMPSDEAQLNRLVQEAREAVEAGNVDGVMSVVSFNYKDERGMSYLLIKRLLEARMKGLTGISVEVSGLSVRSIEKAAYIEIDARASSGAGGSRSYWVGGEDHWLHISAKLGKEASGQWKVQSASYDYRDIR